MGIEDKNESMVSGNNNNNLGTGCQENFYTYSDNRTITRKSEGTLTYF
jgi:hypothetical protein